MTTEIVKTWLPVFSGFYGTIWESDSLEEQDLENINELRKDKGLPPVEWDDVEWDYLEYHDVAAREVTDAVRRELIELGLIVSCKFEKISSPREYNFINDSIACQITLSNKNDVAIEHYLQRNKEAFTKYLQDHYTSNSGFFSSHSNRVEDWLDQKWKDVHGLGAVLNFILLNENPKLEMDIYEELITDGLAISIKNYAALVKGK